VYWTLVQYGAGGFLAPFSTSFRIYFAGFAEIVFRSFLFSPKALPNQNPKSDARNQKQAEMVKSKLQNPKSAANSSKILK
jgi:hypothetical protein